MVALNTYPQPNVLRALLPVGVRRALRIGIACLTVLASAESQADACSCPFFEPCQRWFATNVFIGTVTAIEDVGDRDPAGLVGSRRYGFEVERSFRGTTSKTLDIIGGTQTAGCDAVFDKGETYIVYASTYRGQLTSGFCSGNLPLRFAEEALDYWTRLSTSRDSGRVFGKVTFDGRPPAPTVATRDRGMPGFRVVVRGDGFSRETRSDADGNYEVLKVPSASYTVAVLPPPPFAPAKPDHKSEMVDLRACEEVNLDVRYDGRISGSLVDVKGRPLQGVMVEAIDAARNDDASSWHRWSFARTDATGRFELTGLSPADYFVGVNVTFAPTVASPYASQFMSGPLPATDTRVFRIGPGERLPAPVWKLTEPLRETRIEGCVVWPDGKPAAGVEIDVRPNLGSAQGSYDWTVQSARDGCFSFRSHEGVSYRLQVMLVSIPVNTEPYYQNFLAEITTTSLPETKRLTLVLKPV